jgi:hypothetical protein
MCAQPPEDEVERWPGIPIRADGLLLERSRK